MALDGAFLSRLCHEIEERCRDGARIDRIAQPSRDELIFHLRWRGGAGKLLLSANAGSARIHFTESSPENPKSPPMFCMLLRKHLSSAKLMAVRQIQLDRIVHLEFESRNELGDLVTITVAMEIMGRHSNIIIVDQDGKIIDAIKRIDPEMSSVRQVLPGMLYALPPMQDKLNLLQAEGRESVARLEQARPIELSRALMDVVQGISPLVAREIAHFATRGVERTFEELTEDQRERLVFYLSGLLQTLQSSGGTPTMVLEPTGRPREFSFLPIRQYSSAMVTKEYPDFSSLLDAFYARRDQMERMKQRSSDLLRILANASDRITKKLVLQREELLECGDREQLRIRGDLINANLYAIQKGDEKAVLPNLYDPEMAEIEISLDPQMTPVQNAQRYYALYRKADTAEKMLTKLIASAESELIYVDTVFDALTRAETEADLAAIRQELVESGYVRTLRKKQQNGKQRKAAALPPLRYRSADGYTILCGRNNLQNDKLTLKESRNYDLWLHTQKIPGSHTIIVSQGEEIPKTTIEQACIIAAYNSKARESTKVPVDFTVVKNVKKPGGAKPGMVIYDHYQTVIVDPDEALVQSLLEK